MTTMDGIGSRARAPRRQLAGIFLLALATLLLELALTRVLSVSLWYHFGFLVISTALLGFGVSGVVLAVWTWLRERAPLDPALAALSIAFGLSTIASFWLMQRIPFDPFSLFAEPRQLLFMPLYYVVIAAPFFCSGLAFSLLLTRGASDVNRLYAFDLVGAGLGCAAIAVVMPAFGGSGSVVVAAALGLFAASVFGVAHARRLAFAGLALGAGAVALAFAADTVLPIAVTPNKRVPPTPSLYTAWNTFSRIDVFERPADPNVPDSRSARRIFFDRGTAATGMIDLRPDVRTYLAEHPLEDDDMESTAAYVGKSGPRVLVIGSGAGSQVLEALAYGSPSITAVEINPIINDVVANRMRDYWGGLFDQPEVTLVTEEGRSYVRRSNETYDAIVSVHTISNAAVASGALSLAENYVLTREAFEDYLDHLSPDGVLYFTRPEAQIPRLVATAREVFERRGLGSPAANIVAYRFPPSFGPGSEGMGRLSFSAGFLLRKTPYTEADVKEVVRRLGRERVGGVPGDGTAPEILYSPFESHSDSIYARLLASSDVRAVYEAEPTELEPATDDRPFFNQHARWSSIGWSTFRDMFTQAGMGRFALEDRPVAEVTLILLLAQSILIATVAILAPLAHFSRRGLATAGRWRYLIYFAGLGLGFIMIEIAFLQRFSLFLGQPVHTFGVVLASLLVFTGVGSHLGARLGDDGRRAAVRAIPMILVALVATALLTPPIFSAALGLSLPWRIAVAVALIAPLGVLLGVPFPSGLREVAREAPAFMPWAWGVNGFFTVTGSVAALILGMAFGFTVVLAVAALCYVASLAAAARGASSHRGLLREPAPD